MRGRSFAIFHAPVAACRRMLAWVLSCALLAALFPMWTVPLSASHDPLQTRESIVAWHADTSESAAVDADHVHDDDPGNGSRHGHQHGHSPADHSHDKPMTPLRHAANERTDRGNNWQAHPGWWADSADLSRLERPPRIQLA